MPALCSIFNSAYYANNYAGIFNAGLYACTYIHIITLTFKTEEN